MIRTVSDNQHDILQSIKTLHCNGKFDVDASYGNGKFYSNPTDTPRHRFDVDDTLRDITVASSDNMPLMSKSVNSIVFDPPFLTYVKAGRTGNGNMVMAKRFGGYWRYDELRNHYTASLKEFARVLRKGGVVVFKCQDIVHNHKLHLTHLNVINWAVEFGFRAKDLFVLTAKHRMPRPHKDGEKPMTQRHARVHHSYFLVLELTR